MGAAPRRHRDRGARCDAADDTGRDLFADTLGSLVGASLLTVWSVSRWSSRRVTEGRCPAEGPRLAAQALVIGAVLLVVALRVRRHTA